ncbi:MAG: c-type cytochrome [Bryobacteraceae bacterium]|nr:c-type cytochrome [Bryobacteraceae bacterium]
MRKFIVYAGVAAALAGCGTPQRSSEQEMTKARLERGRYLVESLVDCLACHSDVDWKTRGAPVVRAGSGGIFPEESLPFKIATHNLTPDEEAGLGKWTDEEIGRAIRNGIGRDGRVLFPIMPYMYYRSMSDEDLASVIAYLRSLPPVRNTPPEARVPEPVQKMLQAPPPVTSVPAPDLSTPEKRGEYLAALGTCGDCHTPIDLKAMRPRADLAFGGGFVLKGPWGTVASSNLTPDPSGIPYYDEALFLTAMRTGHVKARALNSIMPWGRYRNLTDEDLKAIFAWLKTLKPVQHRVDNEEPPTPCKLCGNAHGLGAQN